LADAVADWEANDRSEVFLLSAARLGQHEEWTADTELALNSAEEDYLAASRAWNETERRRRRRRRRWTLAGFAAAAVVAAGFGTAALINADRAEEHAAEAEAARSEAEARRISAQSNALAGFSGAALAEDPELALLLSLEAAETEAGPAAVKALQDALQAHRRRLAILAPEDGMEFGARAGVFSPDGRWLVSGGIAQMSDGPALQIWALDDPDDPFNTLPYEGDRSPFMAFSQESDAVLVMTPHTEDDPLRLNFRVFTVPEVELIVDRDLPPLECVVPFEVPSQGSTPYFDLTRPILLGAVDPLPDGSCPEFGPATVWSFDLHTGDLVPLGPGSEFYFSNPTVSEDGTRLASAQGPPFTPEGLPARGVFDVATGDLLLELPYGVSAISADGTLVLAGTNPVELLEVDTGRKLREYDADAPGDVYFSSDESMVYIDESTDISRVFDRFTGELLFEMPGAADPQMSEDGRSMGSLGVPALSLHVSNIAAPLQSQLDALTLLAPAGGFIEWATNISDDRIVAVVRAADGDRASHVYDRHSGELLLTLDGIAGAISPDGTLVGMQARLGTVELDDERTEGSSKEYVVFGPLQLVDLVSGEATVTLGGLCEWYNSVFEEIPGAECVGFPVAWMDWIRDFDFSPDGSLLAAAGKSGYVAVWDTSSGEMVWQLDTDAGRSLWPIGFPDVAFSPDGDELAVFRGDLNSRFGLLSIVGTGDWSTTWEFPTEHLVSELAYAPNDSYLVASTLGHTLELYDTSAGRHLGTLGPQAGPVVDVAISPDSRLIATASDDGESWVWDASARAVEQRLAFPVQQRLINVEFLDEQAILLGSEFEAVVLFLDADRLLQVAKSRLTRSFTENECATYGIDPCPTLEVMLSR
jgi:WD40 repeat protein